MKAANLMRMSVPLGVVQQISALFSVALRMQLLQLLHMAPCEVLLCEFSTQVSLL